MSAVTADIALFTGPFLFVRHGETQANLDGTVAGWRDVPLTALGLAQAASAAAALRDCGATALYVSALCRARQTAAAIAAVTGLSPIVIAELNERCWGDLEGRPRSLRVAGVTPAGAETPQAFQDRVLRGLARVAPGGLPLIVAHSGVFRVLCRALQLPEMQERLPNAAPMRFDPPISDLVAWRIRRL